MDMSRIETKIAAMLKDGAVDGRQRRLCCYTVFEEACESITQMSFFEPTKDGTGKWDKIPADRDSSEKDNRLNRARTARNKCPPPTTRLLRPLISWDSSTESSSAPSDQTRNNIETEHPHSKSKPEVKQALFSHYSVTRMDTDETPPYFYDQPPPPVVRQTFDLNPNYKIYMPEESSYTAQLLPPLIDQERIPHYIRSHYGDPPPYSTLWK
ncbi:unnamed protein product [Echinostoma caproni]|uniref:Expressed conserved protein n=1 Tax=Echinostoma caproni TaxID=27848 RepID=A0A183AII6_9TREM|nr:unnamed protein product [Echinostoma caproni]